MSWSYQKDDSNEFFNPLICLSTNKIDKVEEDMIILGKGKKYLVKFIKVLNIIELEGKILHMQISQDSKI